MLLAKVVGSVWGGKEAFSLGVRKLLQVRPVKYVHGDEPYDIEADKADAELSDSVMVVVDQLGAGIGEYVLVGHGSRIRDLTVGETVPTKEVVLAIVDSCHVDPGYFPEGKGV